MDINDLRSIFTVLVIVMFAGIVGWAYSSKRKDSFDEAAKLALDDEDVSLRGGNAGQQHN
jgi:cytochrome c oxidase cbb3-type subunit 4